MFGSSSVPLVQDAGSVVAMGACAIGCSPPSWSDCVLERYGQNVTALESDTPAGQLASGTAAPLTGFSGIGGLYVVADGVTASGQTAGPGVGSVTAPVRRPHQLFCASTGLATFGEVPSTVVFRTPNALSVMLLRAIIDPTAPTSRTPAPRRRFWLFSAWLPRAYGSLSGVGANTLPTGAPSPCTRFDDTVVSLI